eukprot:93230-Prorocentrum_minimum.AAC.1
MCKGRHNALRGFSTPASGISRSQRLPRLPGFEGVYTALQWLGIGGAVVTTIFGNANIFSLRDAEPNGCEFVETGFERCDTVETLRRIRAVLVLVSSRPHVVHQVNGRARPTRLAPAGTPRPKPSFATAAIHVSTTVADSDNRYPPFLSLAHFPFLAAFLWIPPTTPSCRYHTASCV